MKTARVEVLPYDPKWKDEYEKIKREIEANLGELIEGIEHVGSTSVEGLCAKPCIDIDVVIGDNSVLDAVIAALGAIGYIHEGDLGISGREAFAYSDKPHLYKHHLYVCPRDSGELHRHITFRELLRRDAEARQKYAAVKMAAAGLYPDDIDGYIEYKSHCIKELYRLCGLEQ